MDLLAKMEETIKKEMKASHESETWEEQEYHEGYIDALRQVIKWIEENSMNQYN